MNHGGGVPAPASPPRSGAIDLSDASAGAGEPTGGPCMDNDGARSSDCCGDSEHGDSVCTSLRPLPLLRSPEFGPDDDIELLLQAIRRQLPAPFHVGRATSDAGDYTDDVCMEMGHGLEGVTQGEGMRGGGILAVLEAREEALSFRRGGGPGEEDVDTLLRNNADICSRSIELS